MSTGNSTSNFYKNSIFPINIVVPGIGTGTAMIEFAEKLEQLYPGKIRWYFYDQSESMVNAVVEKLTKSKLMNVWVGLNDLNDTTQKFPSSHFIICLMTIHWTLNKNATLENIASSLDPNGFFFYSVPQTIPVINTIWEELNTNKDWREYNIPNAGKATEGISSYPKITEDAGFVVNVSNTNKIRLIFKTIEGMSKFLRSFAAPLNRLAIVEKEKNMTSGVLQDLYMEQYTQKLIERNQNKLELVVDISRIVASKQQNLDLDYLFKNSSEQDDNNQYYQEFTINMN